MAYTVNNPRFPHYCKIIRPVASSSMDDDEKGTVLFEGECRSYSSYQTNDKGVVISSIRKLAVPKTQWEWTEETIPQEGDQVVVFKTGFNEYGIIVDRLPNNFGTDFIWRFDRN